VRPRVWVIASGIVLLAAGVACRAAPLPPSVGAPSGSAAAPAPAPAAWVSLIGEYERGGRHLTLLEQSETLRIRIDSGPLRSVALTAADSLIPLRDDSSVLRLAIERTPDRDVTALAGADGRWTRRALGGGTFRITPLHTAAELRAAALAATPPAARQNEVPGDLVEVATLDSTLHLDIRYATTNNFMGERFYDAPRAFLQRPAAEALVRADRRLAALGYGLLIHDAYRPWYVTWMFWQATPDSLKRFVADPATGSRHNRGAAVDVTLYQLATGAPVSMPSGYDEFSERAYPDYPGGTSRQRWHRDLLRAALEAEGFQVYQYEWWHFDFQGWERYPVLNLPFDQIDRKQ
jgi:D-alanyl-D-alanine dipeptidase